MSIRSKAADSEHIPTVFVLNCQDKKSMSVTENKTNTLLAKDSKHQPSVLVLNDQGGDS